MSQEQQFNNNDVNLVTERIKLNIDVYENNIYNKDIEKIIRVSMNKASFVDHILNNSDNLETIISVDIFDIFNNLESIYGYELIDYIRFLISLNDNMFIIIEKNLNSFKQYVNRGEDIFKLNF